MTQVDTSLQPLHHHRSLHHHSDRHRRSRRRTKTQKWIKALGIAAFVLLVLLVGVYAWVLSGREHPSHSDLGIRPVVGQQATAPHNFAFEKSS